MQELFTCGPSPLNGSPLTAQLRGCKEKVREESG